MTFAGKWLELNHHHFLKPGNISFHSKYLALYPQICVTLTIVKEAAVCSNQKSLQKPTAGQNTEKNSAQSGQYQSIHPQHKSYTSRAVNLIDDWRKTCKTQGTRTQALGKCILDVTGMLYLLVSTIWLSKPELQNDQPVALERQIGGNFTSPHPISHTYLYTS